MLREGLTAAKLAEIVGVQPSAISHILSGRNYPRFDFLHNLLKAYPEMNARWLLLGENDIYTHANALNGNSGASKDILDTPAQKKESITEKNVCDETQSEVSAKATEAYKCLETKSKTVDRIVIFYDDGTFAMYENK